MQTFFKFFLLVIFVFSLSYIKVSAQDMEELKSTIAEMNKTITEAMMNRDNEKMLSYYTEDAMSLPSYNPMIEGKDALKQMMMMDSNSGNKITKFDLTSKKILPAGDLLIDVGTYDMSMDIPGMPQPMNDRGKYVTIYEKQDDGTWKIKVETWNSDINPWMNNENMPPANEDTK